MEDLREAIRIAREADLAEVLGATLGNLAYLTWFREGPAAALVIAREIQSFAGARGLSFDEMWGGWPSSNRASTWASWDHVLALAEEMLAWDAEHGPSQIGMWARFATPGSRPPRRRRARRRGARGAAKVRNCSSTRSSRRRSRDRRGGRARARRHVPRRSRRWRSSTRSWRTCRRSACISCRSWTRVAVWGNDLRAAESTRAGGPRPSRRAPAPLVRDRGGRARRGSGRPDAAREERYRAGRGLAGKRSVSPSRPVSASWAAPVASRTSAAPMKPGAT